MAVLSQRSVMNVFGSGVQILEMAALKDMVLKLLESMLGIE